MRYAYCRPDPKKWYAMPGVIAAYQPIGAPNRVMSLQNMAHNAPPGSGNITFANVATWTRDGWYSAGQYDRITSSLLPTSHASALMRFSGVSADGAVFGGNDSTNFFLIRLSAASGVSYRYGTASVSVAPTMASGVVGMTSFGGYRNGVKEAAWSAETLAGAALTVPIYFAVTGNLLYRLYPLYTAAFALYSTILSDAEMQRASLQMAYCDLNPDWSPWGRQRQWFYYGPTAGFQAAWARGNNRLIGGGVN